MEPVDPLRQTEVESSLTPTAQADRASSRARLSRGATVHRYVIVDFLGEGGMGIVYSAYDSALDRKVALKLLRVDDSGKHTDEDRARLLREAQTMARLSHPNVITVHDVGMFQEQIFVAMEFADGGSLRTWLQDRPRSQREVLQHFIQAGRGLQAAHAIGLIHRDFKPDNVLLSKSGRVYVADFGLARQLNEATDLSTSRIEPQPARPATTRSTTLTQTGAIVGTPAYMSPEQGQGKPTDARTDQFSYCVALYEAVYGQHPFEGDTMAALLSQASAGQVRPPPAGSKVPWRIERALWRGLSANPDDRYPSMEALLAALRNKPRQVTLRVLLIVVALALIGWVGSAYLGLRRPHKRVCQTMEERLRDTWNDSRRRSLRAAFAATGTPYAESTTQEVERVLLRYVQEWSQTQTEVCEAARVRRVQTRQILDERMECLRQRLQEAQSLLQIFAKADAKVVERAVPAVHALTAVEGCAEREAIITPPPPADEALRLQVTELRTRLAEAKAQSVAGQYEAGLQLAAEIVKRAQQAAYRPLEAEALLQLGELQARAGKPLEAEQTLYEAIFAAEAGRHLMIAAHASANLVHVLGFLRNQFPLAHHAARDAAARIEGLGGNGELSAILSHHHALVYNAQGRYAEALPLAQRAVEIRRRLGAQPFTLIAPLRTVGQVLQNLGRHDDALAILHEALALGKNSLGEAHTQVASSLHAIAGVNLLQARFAEAEPYFAQALSINESALGATHPDTGLMHFGLSSSALRQGRYEEGLRHAEQAAAILRAALGAESVQAAAAEMNVGYALMRLGRYPEALRQAQLTLKLFENRVDSRLLHRGYALIVLGETQLGLQKPRQAVAPLEEAVALFAARLADRDALALARFALARALMAQEPSPDRTRALSLARQARGDFSPQLDPKVRAQVDGWLAQHEPKAQGVRPR